MESYFVHIYHRETDDRTTVRSEVIGLVEIVEDERRIPFRNARELWNILTGAVGMPDDPS